LYRDKEQAAVGLCYEAVVEEFERSAGLVRLFI